MLVLAERCYFKRDYLNKWLRLGKWQADFESGKICFDKQEFDMQFIGSESFSSNTWLWGYENVNGFDERLLALANRAREFGEKFGLEAFSTAQFDLDENVNGHTLSMVACVALGEELSYYKIDYDGGAAYVAVRAETIFKEPVLANDLGLNLNSADKISNLLYEFRLKNIAELLLNRT